MSCCDDHDHSHQGGHNHEEEHNHEEHNHGEVEGHEHEHHQSEHTESPELIEQKKKLLQLFQKKKAAEKEELKRKSAELKKKYLPVLKFMKNNGLQFKMASIKNDSVQYFRLDEFKKILQDKKDKIATDPVVSELLKSWSEIFFYYKRIDGQPHLKWPVQLQNSTQKQGSKFASFPFDSSESSKVMTVLAIVAILGILCFPLWPYEVKYYMWLLSLWSTILFIVIFFIRLVLYLLGAVFGGSFWVFPRLLQNIGFMESWKPVYSWQWWDGSNVYSVITRVAVLGIFVYYGMHIYSDPLFIKENLDITKTIIDDINDWGISKMKGERNFSQSALTDYSQLLNSTLAEDENEEVIEVQKSPEVQL